MLRHLRPRAARLDRSRASRRRLPSASADLHQSHSPRRLRRRAGASDRDGLGRASAAGAVFGHRRAPGAVMGSVAVAGRAARRRVERRALRRCSLSRQPSLSQSPPARQRLSFYLSGLFDRLREPARRRRLSQNQNRFNFKVGVFGQRGRLYAGARRIRLIEVFTHHFVDRLKVGEGGQ